MKAIAIHEPGGHEVQRLEDVETLEPGAGGILIRVKSAGANYADNAVRQSKMFGPRRGTFRVMPGLEVAGTVVTLGEGIDR